MNLPLPEEVRIFVEQHIDCTEQLEILRILGDHPEKRWDIPSLAAEIQVAQQDCSSYLRVLQSHGLLLAIQRDGATLWQHGSPSEETRTMASRLLQTYKERPVTMIRMVYAKKAKALEAFSDAFRLRKEG